MSATIFVNVLKEFLANIAESFPENEGVKEGLNWLNILPDSTHPQMMQSWAKLTSPVVTEIQERNSEVVARIFDESSNPILSKINAKHVFANSDEQSLECVWQFLGTLTALSTNQTPPESSGSEEPLPVMPPTITTPVPSVQTNTPTEPQPQAPKQPADVIKGITAAIPEIFKSLNDLMKNKGDDNPLGQILNQMLNPNGLQTGVAPNLAANLFDNGPSNVMQQVSAETGLRSEEIIQKLQRLEMYERARAKKKKH